VERLAPSGGELTGATSEPGPVTPSRRRVPRAGPDDRRGPAHSVPLPGPAGRGGNTLWFADVPPDTASAALGLVDPSLSTGRGTGQPPAILLVQEARRRSGRLGGSLNVDYGFLPHDTICVDGDQGPALVRSVLEAWPADENESEAALDLADGHVWTSWSAGEPAWTGRARELLASPPAGEVVGLWWD